MNYVVESRAFKESAVSISVDDLWDQIAAAVTATRQSVAIYRTAGGLHYPSVVDSVDAQAQAPKPQTPKLDEQLYALLPPIYPEWLGDRSFLETHEARFAYVAGEMARGIASTKMVIAAVRAGFVGFFGSAGLGLAEIKAALAEIKAALGPDAAAWGANLIHNPDRPDIERATVELFLEQGVRRVSASAFMRLSPDIVHYAVAGLSRRADGGIARDTHVFAKISRPEIARQFMQPAPADILRALVAEGRISPAQADLASEVPIAEDITVEGDSGGHTDNRPITSLFPVMARLRDDIAASQGYRRPIRLGLAGGIGTPSALAAAFQQGAAYVVVASVNQSAVEAGISEAARAMLAQADVADMIMAPAADMFELGVKVQVLKRGTMFAVKGQKLYELYRRYDGLEALPEKDRTWLETQVLRKPVAAAWTDCREHLRKSNPAQLDRADMDAKLRMALVFRAYLFFGAQWAREGSDDRRIDYQIWCGPAMGAFNDWVRGSCLEPIANRSTAKIGLNLLEGAAAITRAQQMRTAGVHVPGAFFSFEPQQLNQGR